MQERLDSFHHANGASIRPYRAALNDWDSARPHSSPPAAARRYSLTLSEKGKGRLLLTTEGGRRKVFCEGRLLLTTRGGRKKSFWLSRIHIQNKRESEDLRAAGMLVSDGILDRGSWSSLPILPPEERLHEHPSGPTLSLALENNSLRYYRFQGPYTESWPW